MTSSLDPLHQFLVKPFLVLKAGNIDFSLTNSSLFMILSVALVVVFFSFSLRKLSLVPSKSQSLGEMPFVLISRIINESTGPSGLPFLSFISSIFLFVFMGNILGLFPFSFTFTSQIIVNFALACLIILIITFYGFYRHGSRFFRLFFPEGVPWWVAPLLVPIEIISYCARPFSLSIRLFANMVAGHSMLKIFSYFSATTGLLGIIPLTVNVGLIGFECLIAFLQAYVFTMLSCIYLSDTLNLH